MRAGALGDGLPVAVTVDAIRAQDLGRGPGCGGVKVVEVEEGRGIKVANVVFLCFFGGKVLLDW